MTISWITQFLIDKALNLLIVASTVYLTFFFEAQRWAKHSKRTEHVERKYQVTISLQIATRSQTLRLSPIVCPIYFLHASEESYSRVPIMFVTIFLSTIYYSFPMIWSWKKNAKLHVSTKKILKSPQNTCKSTRDSWDRRSMKF